MRAGELRLAGMARRIASYLIYPALLAGALLAARALSALGWPLPALLLVVNGAACLLILLGERWLPCYREWQRARGDVLTDAAGLIFSVTLAGTLGQGLALGLAELLAWTPRWPASWSVWAQLPLALVLGELGNYWIHRAQHEGGGWLWRLHAAHHSAPRLYWLNGNRLHPADSLLAAFCYVAPLALLGAPPEVFLLSGVYGGVHLALQHANLDYRLGPLNWILSGAELHRWHHSKIAEEANANYGSILLVWDVIFGTRFAPKGRRPPVEVGLIDMPDFPTGYLGQLLSPLRRDLWR